MTSIDEQGRYIIDHYGERPPFASFLPGIAGPLGIPLWVFYVNRGQGVASFGIESKNSSIVEFQPANKAYQSVSTLGFRTFMKLKGRNGSSTYYEPFAKFAPGVRPNSQMRTGFNDLSIRDINDEHGVETRVTYFVLPSENVAALVRKVVVRNMGRSLLRGELLDGLPAIVPFGVCNWLQKEMSNTMAAWMRAENLEELIPFYRVEASVEDQPEVEQIEAGHFYLCFTGAAGRTKRLRPIVDPRVVFGSETSFAYPEMFIKGSLTSLYDATQIATGKQPCGFFGTSFALEPREEINIYALIGHASNIGVINKHAERLSRTEYLEDKHIEAESLVTEITKATAASTACCEFDFYCAQGFLDNVLRGGYPLVFPREGGVHVYHLYTRRHGDLERDYNFFSLAPECYAQGNGAYRDINQNRRCDVLIEPAVEDRTIVSFINLLQIDGYNPLELRPSKFTLDQKGREAIAILTGGDKRIFKLIKKPFTIGKVLDQIDTLDIRLTCDRQTFVSELLRNARQVSQAAHQEGYWVDHWTYNMDLIDNYLAIYPDREEELLFDRYDYSYFDTSHIVMPRSEKHVEIGGLARQSNAVVNDPEKAEIIEGRDESPNKLRTRHGRGKIYRTNLYAKLFGLCVNKFATLDPSGMGIEMEAGKPGWCDALNGLPALFGSSMSETYELRRLIVLLRKIEQYPDRRFSLPQELWTFVLAIKESLEAYEQEGDDFANWDRVYGAREAFRASTRLGIDGKEIEVGVPDVMAVLEMFLAKVERGLERAIDLNGGFPATYFVHEPKKWTRLTDASGDAIRNSKGQEVIRVESFAPRPLPLFLEGLVKAVRFAGSSDVASTLHSRVKDSELHDNKLGMYKLNASLIGEPPHIGRTRAYTPGWLENESIFLHMHYKYLLALMYAGLDEEFWKEARHCLVPFLDPERYGRSVLENSSFITSSAHPDASLHGRGFVARLSGATIEFMSMWSRATAGPQPFRMTPDGLVLEFQPSLPGWLFKEDGTLSFTFLGKIEVVYHSTSQADVFPNGGTEIERMTLVTLSDEPVEIQGSRVADPWASKVREREIKRIDIFLTATGSKHEQQDSDCLEVPR